MAKKIKALPLEIRIRIINKRGIPSVELRRLCTDPEIIKGLVVAALKNQPVIIMPCFQSKMQSVASMIQHGMLIYDSEKGTYEFII